MTAAPQTIAPLSNNPFTFPLEARTIGRHAAGWTVAWWFFAKILPVFITVGAGLGFSVSTLGTILDGMSHYSIICGPWMVPACLIGDCAVSLAAQHMGGRLWLRRWTLAVEICLFAAVVLAMLVFFRPLLPIWIAGAS